MRCRNCGFELKADWDFCPNCNCPVNKGGSTQFNNDQTNNFNYVDNNQKRQEESIDKGLMIIIAVIAVSEILGLLILQIWILCQLISVIALVTGVIRYPDNKTMRIVMGVYLAVSMFTARIGASAFTNYFTPVLGRITESIFFR